MPIFEILALIVMAALAWLWFDSVKAHEAGVEAARAACASEDLQLLDETVALSKLQPVRNDEGRMTLRRIYVFEYSDTGDNRRRGSVVVLGHEVVVVNIGLRLVPSGRTLH
jgi:hypothetical protein